MELIVHHSDSYAANLVPSMLEMGVDIWQGVFPENDIPKLVEQYGGRITFMGEIRTLAIDLPNVTDEEIDILVDSVKYTPDGYLPAFGKCDRDGVRAIFEAIRG